MRQVIQEAKKWVPLHFYDCRQAGNSVRHSIPASAEMFVRYLLHMVIYFLITSAFIVIFGRSARMLQEAFWETQIGTALAIVLAVIIVLVPVRIARRPSYLLYKKIFKNGLYES